RMGGLGNGIKAEWRVRASGNHDILEDFPRSGEIDHHRAFRKEEGNRDPAFLLSEGDRKSTRLNSSHVSISYAVFCLKQKTELIDPPNATQRNVRPGLGRELRLYGEAVAYMAQDWLALLAV